ncbi:hypothetical protein ANCCEY_13558 [Ancylostoma ceylanicum]|uniref:RING-type domain-containing protein n=1 Tax=Ancylostoma ceylanicum TaxID=53326 RepID=A0A0D6LC00_9BILA|nr:hypothetical protein ANCCEY_13558 [Ancylostoma ceylanicum]
MASRRTRSPELVARKNVSIRQNLSSSGMRQAHVCFDNRPGVECVKFFPCDHIFCKDCVKSYFQTRLSSQAVSRLSCLADGCSSYPAESLIVELLGPEQFERYQRIILSNALSQMENFAVCPRVSCQNPGTISSA